MDAVLNFRKPVAVSAPALADLADAWITELPGNIPALLELEHWFKQALHANPLSAEAEQLLANALCHWFENTPRAAKRPKETRAQFVRKQILVATCMSLVGAGVDLNEAAKSVVDLASKCKIYRPGGDAITVGTVKIWRRKLQSSAGCRLLAQILSRPDLGRSPKQIIAVAYGQLAA